MAGGIVPLADGRLLRFSAALANLGPGPLTLLPQGRGRCDPGQHAARQVVHVDRNRDGFSHPTRDRRHTQQFSGCMLRHVGHDHWHFDAMASYALRRPGATRPPGRPAADPRDLIEETTESDNGTSGTVRIDGTDVRRVPGAHCNA